MLELGEAALWAKLNTLRTHSESSCESGYEPGNDSGLDSDSSAKQKSAKTEREVLDKLADISDLPDPDSWIPAATRTRTKQHSGLKPGLSSCL